MGAVRGQLTRLSAGATAEFGVVFVGAVFGAHDQLTVGEETIVHTVRVDVNSWRNQTIMLFCGSSTKKNASNRFATAIFSIIATSNKTFF